MSFPHGQFQVLIQGWGIRARNDLKHFVATVLADPTPFVELHKIGHPIHFSFVVFESQSSGFEGGGIKLSTDAMVNTGIAEPFGLEGTGVPQGYQSVFEAATNLPKRVRKYVNANYSKIRDHCAANNPAGLVMFQNAWNGEVLDTKWPCVPRWVIKAVEDETVAEIIQFCRSGLNEAMGLPSEAGPFIQIHIRHDCKVIASNVTGRLPWFLVEQDGVTSRHYGHFLSQVTGATSSLPKFMPQVLDRVYHGESNHTDIMKYLDRMNVTHNKAILPGKHIIIMGCKLSAFDRLTMLLNSLPIWNSQNVRGRQRLILDPKRCGPYQNLITLLTRGQSSLPAPRLGLGHNLPGDERPENDHRTLNSKHVHAAFLSGHPRALPMLLEITEAIVAAKLGKLPKELIHNQSKQRQIEEFQRDIDEFWCSEDPNFIETEQLRIHFSRILSGMGFNSTAFESELELNFPITRRGLAPSAIDNAWNYNASDPDYAGTTFNVEHFDALDTIMRYIIAAPPDVWGIMAQAWQNGIANFRQGSVEDVTLDCSGDMSLGGDKVDALLASQVLSGSAEHSFASLKGKVQELVPGVPAVGPYRVFKLPDGSWAPQCSHSMLGEGARTRNGLTVGCQYQDTIVAALIPERAVQKADLVTKLGILGCREAQPLRSLQRLHESSNPHESDYEAEVSRFEPYWYELCRAYDYIRSCTAVSTDREQFATLVSAAFGHRRRDSGIDSLDHVKEDAYNSLKDDSLSDRPFRPMDLKRFTQVLVDPRPEQMRKVREMVYKRAGITVSGV